MPGPAEDRCFQLRVLLRAGPLPSWLGHALSALDAQAGLQISVRRVPGPASAPRLSWIERACLERVPALLPWPVAGEHHARLASWEAAADTAQGVDAVLAFDAADLVFAGATGAAEQWRIAERVQGHGASLLEAFPAIASITAGTGVKLQLLRGAAVGHTRPARVELHVAADAAYASGLNVLSSAVVRLVMSAVRAAPTAQPALPDNPASGAALVALAAPQSLVWRRWLAGLWRAWSRRQQARLFSEYWRIGVIDAPIGQVLVGGPHPGVRWITPRQGHGYWADPFGLPGDPTRLACEFFDERTGVGHLERLHFDARQQLVQRTRLDVGKGEHLSFPHVTVIDGRSLAVAENATVRQVTLHEVEADGRWRPIATLLHGVAAADPALFAWQGRYWLAYTDVDEGAADNLCLLHAAALEGPWQPHAGNPVKIDVRSARMAGAFIVHDGTLYRPGQDGLQTYGAAVALHRVDRLTPAAYEEHEIGRLEPDPLGDCPHGLHTLTAWGERTLIDGKRHGLNLHTLWRKLRRRGRVDSSAVAPAWPSGALMVYVPHLRLGGAESSMLRLAEGLAREGQPVLLVVHSMASCELLLPAGLEVITLNVTGTARALFPLVRLLRARRPRALLTAFPHTNVVAVAALALARTNTRCVITEHAPLSRQIVQQGSWGYRVLPTLVRWAYRRADAVVAVSEGVRSDLQALVGAGVAPQVIHNPVLPPDLQARLQQVPDHPWLCDQALHVVLSVSRLSEEKDLPMLVRAFALLHRERPQARLLLAGEGPAREAVQALIDQLGLRAVVQLPGRVAEPLHWMHRAAVFALASRYEGFGNVLVEALAAGAPVVSTDCPVGPREILAGGRFGELVPVGDADAMCAALARALDLQRKQPEGARAAALQFTHERACAAYLRLFNGLQPAQARPC